MAVSNGNCFICGKTAGKVAIKNHVLKEHRGFDEHCYLIKAEGTNNKDYWLFFEVPIDADLYVVDDFLRHIWCECCGHLSAFRIGREEIENETKLAYFRPGATLLYEYDFGSTTSITVTFVADVLRKKQQNQVRLLARNVPMPRLCEQCGDQATMINSWEYMFVCDKCAKNADDEGALMQIVNSPRCGVCGYEGDTDVWTFAPSKIPPLGTTD